MLASEGKQVLSDFTGTLRLTVNSAQVFLSSLINIFPTVQKLGEPPDGGYGIVQLGGNARSQLSHRSQAPGKLDLFLPPPLLLFNSLALGDILHRQQNC